jgi:hypothetical protein
MPAGEVFRMDAGVGVTAPEPLAPGWRHVIAMRRGDTLSLHVDGRRVALHRDPLVASIDAACAAPLKLGAGRFSPLRSAVGGMTLYNRALTEAEIASLAVANRGARP